MVKMGKGLVMEATSKTLVLMTAQGEFVKIPWGKKEVPALGSEIEYTLPRQGFFSSQKFLVIAASLVFFLFVVPFLSAYFLVGEQPVIAYVSIDINPSLELGLDQEGIVKEAKGLNEEGQKLLTGIQFANHPLDKVIKLITQKAVKQQYLAVGEENNIVVTFSAREEREKKFRRQTKQESQKKAEMLTKIETNLIPEVKEELKRQNVAAKVEVLEVSSQFYENAQKAGVSPGKYAVILEAMKEGYDVSPEDVKFSSIVKTIKAAGGNPGTIISRTKKEEKRLLEIEKEMKKEIKKRANKEKKEEKLKAKEAKKADSLKQKEQVKHKSKQKKGKAKQE